MLGPCWHYVGSFFALGSLFACLARLLTASSALSARLGLFCCVLERSGIDFGGFRDGPGMVFGCIFTYFLMCFSIFSCLWNEKRYLEETLIFDDTTTF